ncbi:hypothetical protein [Streptomyces sp. ID05-18]|nr:hypothetical protein [Streptomyces sp. ID05-18]MDX3490968.1 hypothetical protein [Streptomyces sp. ID05-18]
MHWITQVRPSGSVARMSAPLSLVAVAAIVAAATGVVGLAWGVSRPPR